MVTACYPLEIKMSRTKEYLFEQMMDQHRRRLGEDKYDPSDSDIKAETTENQTKMILQWFFDRYCDPAQETPYVSEEGGYLFIWGGPYDPNEEIPERFDGVASEEAIEAAIEKLVREVGTEWAPIEHDVGDDYDEDYEVPVQAPESSLQRLQSNLNQFKDLLAVAENSNAAAILPMVYAGSIGALESYLYEVSVSLLKDDPNFAKYLITRGVLFKTEKIDFKDIYKIHENIEKKILGHFQNMVWHRWKEVELILKSGLSIDVSINDRLRTHTMTRHDITHRSSRTKDGDIVNVTTAMSIELITLVENVANEIHTKVEANKRSREEDPFADLL